MKAKNWLALCERMIKKFTKMMIQMHTSATQPLRIMTEGAKGLDTVVEILSITSVVDLN